MGNVLVTVSDMPIGKDDNSDGTVDYYTPNILTVSDYEPFGAPLENRTESENLSYRFGFNGKEKIDEVSEEGNIYDYGFRIYSPRIGKFLSVDPLTRSYPWYTPYQFAGNGPICNIDLDGLEDLDFRNKPDATMTDMVDHGAPGALFQRPISSMMNIIRKDIAIISGDDEYLHGRWVVGDPDPWTEETSLYYVVEKVPTDGNPLETAMESLDALGVTGGGGVAGQAMAKVPTAYGAALREVSVTGKKVWQNFSTVGDVLNKSFKDARGLYEIKFKDGSSYIGRTINFYRRMKQHFKYDRSKFHAMIDEIESIGFLRKNANTTIKELREGEQDLIDVFRKAGKKLKNQRDEIAKTKRDN